MIQVKNEIVIEVENRRYVLNISPESPLGELYDVIMKYREIVVNLINKQDEKS